MEFADLQLKMEIRLKCGTGLAESGLMGKPFFLQIALLGQRKSLIKRIIIINT